VYGDEKISNLMNAAFIPLMDNDVHTKFTVK